MKTHTAAEAAQLAHTDPRTLERIELLERSIGLCTAQMERANEKREHLCSERHSVQQNKHDPLDSKQRYYLQSDAALSEVEADYRCYRRLRALAQTEQRQLFPVAEALQDADWLNDLIESMEPDAILSRRSTNGD